MRIGGETAAYAYGESGFDTADAPAGDGSEADVVDLGIIAPRAAAGDGHLELAGEIVKLGVAAQRAIDFQRERRGIAEFVGVETGQWATGDVAGDVAAGADGGEASAPERFDDVGKRVYGDPVQLHVLADGDVGDAAGVALGEIGDGAGLPAGKEAVGDADAHHEEFGGFAFAVFSAGDAYTVALGVNAPGTEIGGEPFRWDGGVAAAGKFLDFVEVLPAVLCALEALDALGFGFRVSAILIFYPPKNKKPTLPEPLARGLRNLRLLTN